MYSKYDASIQSLVLLDTNIITSNIGESCKNDRYHLAKCTYSFYFISKCAYFICPFVRYKIYHQNVNKERNILDNWK